MKDMKSMKISEDSCRACSSFMLFMPFMVKKEKGQGPKIKGLRGGVSVLRQTNWR